MLVQKLIRQAGDKAGAHPIHQQPDGAADGWDSETGEEQVDALEHHRAGEPAQHTADQVLQPEALRQAETELLKPRADIHPDKDNIGES